MPKAWACIAGCDRVFPSSWASSPPRNPSGFTSRCSEALRRTEGTPPRSERSLGRCEFESHLQGLPDYCVRNRAPQKTRADRPHAASVTEECYRSCALLGESAMPAQNDADSAARGNLGVPLADATSVSDSYPMQLDRSSRPIPPTYDETDQLGLIADAVARAARLGSLAIPLAAKNAFSLAEYQTPFRDQ